MPYYSVANGRIKGVFLNWDDCKHSVTGFKNAIYKKFETEDEAKNFISERTIENGKERFIPDYFVYTDGSCRNNGRLDAISGIGVFFGIADERNVSERVIGKQTNNIAELSAVIKAGSIIESDIKAGKKIEIVTDSEYVIKCVYSYGEKCNKKGWENVDIPNKDLVKLVFEMFNSNPNIQFSHVRAHTGNTDIHSMCNDLVDKLANAAIDI